MIPKIIHYCWFGGQPLPEAIQFARDSWIQTMPDYELREWNESNTILDSCEYVEWCAREKKWAFLSDYVKADVLARFGGVFLDADVVTHRSLSSFLHHRAFSGFEASRLPFTAVWGSEPGHPWPVAAVHYLEGIESAVPTGHEYLEPNTLWMTRLLSEQFAIDPMIDTYQEGSEGVTIYPSETLCLGTHNGWATHLFSGSWLPKGERGNYGVRINNIREASLRLELFEPLLLVRIARLLTFADLGESCEATSGFRGVWVSEDLPAQLGLWRATRTAIGILASTAMLCARGLRARVGPKKPAPRT